MRKYLVINILGTIGLTVASTTTLIACHKVQSKLERQINVQQPPTGSNWEPVYANDNAFRRIDCKYYIVIWHGLFNNNWKINKFNNNVVQIRIDMVSDWLMKNFADLQIGYGRSWKDWKNYPHYFKAVYRWNRINDPNLPEINKDGNITDWKE
ncbi:DUF3688 family protein [Spiroplasma sp. SV19]|uniref:DUF3688 family protein n=1 Tax=Spiroplasma sp. SV19 TaxID=2570468 RepID=UPI0024B6B94D|nr:DUF3688 family protein [Spiroplasma sp. SV19]WHQ37228.1 DUF3688 domain-containing protein [Spiroplasma sp. SV19]